MKKVMMFVALAVFALGISCYASASQGEGDKARAPEVSDQNGIGEDIIVIETVAYQDTCAKNPKSPCLKGGKCACVDKSACKECKKGLKKCDAATQAKCQKMLKDGTMPCPAKKDCPKAKANCPKDAKCPAGKTCPKDKSNCPKDAKCAAAKKASCPVKQ